MDRQPRALRDDARGPTAIERRRSRLDWKLRQGISKGVPSHCLPGTYTNHGFYAIRGVALTERFVPSNVIRRSAFTNFYSKPLAAEAEVAENSSVEADPFVADITRLLLTFFSVVIIDLVVVSLMTHRLRVWFPVWLDPEWATRPDPWVVY